MRYYNIMEYNATGKGQILDTKAIQTAINSCYQAGGGVVYCPPGTYLCGTLNIKSNVELYLEAGATILGSSSLDDYTREYNASYDTDIERIQTAALHLICAVKEHNVAIRGRGCIHGNGPSFFGPPQEDHPLRRFAPIGWRPSYMLAFCECTDVLVEGVHLTHAPFYTLWPYLCERVRIDNVKITNPPETPNGDGIDIDASKDVIISNCYIDTADDCIALYCLGGGGLTDSSSYVTENVLVTNCILKTCCVGIRLGPHGDGSIRNCLFNTITIEAGNGIGFHAFENKSYRPGDFYYHIHGPSTENIRFSGITMKVTSIPIIMEIHDDATFPACINNVHFSDMHIDTTCAMCISGSNKIPIQNVSFKNIEFTCDIQKNKNSFTDIPYPLPKLGIGISDKIPHLIYARHFEDIELHTIKIRQKGEKLSPVMRFEQGSRLYLGNVRLQEPVKENSKEIQINNVEPVFFNA